MKYTIKSSIAGERILVNAEFRVKGDVVQVINTAFPLETSAEEIKAEIEKAGDLYEQEAEQKEEQGKVDEKYEKVQDTINKLNSNK